MKKSFDAFDWDDSWFDFVESVAYLHRSGLTPDELTKNYIGSDVKWRGEVQDVKLDNDMYAHLGIQMPYHETKLSSGRLFRAQRLVISVGEDQKDCWSGCTEGMEIKFRAILGFSEFGKPSIEVYEPTGPGRDSLPATLKITVFNASIVTT